MWVSLEKSGEGEEEVEGLKLAVERSNRSLMTVKKTVEHELEWNCLYR